MVYDIIVKDNKGEDVSLSVFKGKVLLVVNTATKCGLTPQYEALQNLYEKYKDRGFEILDFPCNQFFEQAPGTDAEVENFCTLNYKTTFKRFSKIDVNGDTAHELFKFLRREAPVAEKSSEEEGLYSLLADKGFKTVGDEIKWNFTKFLIDAHGKVVARFAPTEKPDALATKIGALLP